MTKLQIISATDMKISKNSRVEQLQDFFKTHNKSKEQKAHTSKVNKFDVFIADFVLLIGWCITLNEHFELNLFARIIFWRNRFMRK